jgi:hypothetical protein
MAIKTRLFPTVGSHLGRIDGIRQTSIRSLQPQGQDKIAEVVIQQRSGRFQGGNVITHVPVRGPVQAARSRQRISHTAHPLMRRARFGRELHIELV